MGDKPFPCFNPGLRAYVRRLERSIGWIDGEKHRPPVKSTYEEWKWATLIQCWWRRRISFMLMHLLGASERENTTREGDSANTSLASSSLPIVMATGCLHESARVSVWHRIHIAALDFFFFVCMCVIKDCAKEFISRLSRFIFVGFGSSAIFSRCESLQPQFSFCRSSLCYTYTSHLGIGIPLLPCWWSCLRLVAGFTCCLFPQLVCLCARLQSKKKKGLHCGR